MTTLAAVTAAHPYLSGIGIWILCTVIATGLWVLCAVRGEDDDEDDAVIPAAPGRACDRRKVS